MPPKSKRRTVSDRFWSKVSGGDVESCWIWVGAANRRTGYGTFCVNKEKYVLPHRFAYEMLRVAIPDGLQIDHLCKTTLCVNPWHMEPVTSRVNVLRSNNAAALNARRDTCPKGHPFTEANTYKIGRQRKCRTCHLDRERSYRAARKQAEVAA